jgi:hypothetical protein
MKLKSLNCSARDKISLESEELEETSLKSKVIPLSEELDTEEFTPEEMTVTFWERLTRR